MYQHPFETMSGFGASAIPTNNLKDPNYLKGRDILYAFHMASKTYPIYKIATVDDLIKSFGNKSYILTQGLGKSFTLSEKPVSYYQEKMGKLAGDSKGRIPKWQAFVDYMTGDMLRTDYWDIVSTGVVAGISQAATAVADTSLATLGAAANVLKILPYIALIGGLGYIYIKFVKDKAH